MSKYRTLGAYHYVHYKTKGSPYQLHVDDVVEQVCARVPKDARIADLGCGEGLVLDVLHKRGWGGHGMELDLAAVDLAHALGNHWILRMDITELTGHKLDAVLLLDVLEHVHKWEQVIDNLCDDCDTGFDIAESDVKWLFLALPDRPDPFAVDEDDHEERHQKIAAYVVTKGFNVAHYQRRHARHFYVFER